MIANTFKRKIKIRIQNQINRFKVQGKTKVFGIGRNKTGTTSLKKAFFDHGFIVGNQAEAEKLVSNYAKNKFDPIISYCKSAQAFQDVPFSYPETYKYLDKAFSNAKFILTIRDSEEQWYDSLLRFHSKKFGEGKTPTATDLKNAKYVYPGWMWQCNRILYDSPESNPYKKDILIKHYHHHNRSVKEYFNNRPNKLLIINIAEQDAYSKFCDFLELEPLYDRFPWENKT